MPASEGRNERAEEVLAGRMMPMIERLAWRAECPRTHCRLAPSVGAPARRRSDEPAKRGYRGKDEPCTEHRPAYPARVREPAQEPTDGDKATCHELDERFRPRGPTHAVTVPA